MKKHSKDTLFWVMCAMIILEIAGFVLSIKESGGIAFIKYYTQESNLVMLVAAICYVAACLFEKNGEIPKWVCILQYVAACLVTVTFVVVITVLAPMKAPQGKMAVIRCICGGSNLFHHLLCPVISVVSFLFLEKRFVPGMKHVIIATIPTLLYAVVTTVLNIAKVMYGPYPFLHVYEQPWFISVMWFIVIPGVGFLFAWLISGIKKKMVKK